MTVDVITQGRRGQGAGPGLSYWLGSKIIGHPVAMEPRALAQLQSAIKAKQFDAAVTLGPSGSRFIGKAAGDSGFTVTDEGVAVVPISGTLIDRGAYLGDFGGWFTTYEGIIEQCRRIKKDPAIKSVIVNIDSGGGIVAGMLDAAAAIADLRKSKKLYAVANNFACSAAYALGCVADEFYCTAQGTVGSIGIIATHMSLEEMLADAGVEATIIHAGAHKADGNPYQRLSHGARSEMTAQVEQLMGDFVAHVSKWRGISADDVRGTEARCYIGAKGVSAKLSDGVKSFDDVLKHIRSAAEKGGRPRGKSSAAKGGSGAMSGNTETGEAPEMQALITAGVQAGMAAAAAAQQPAAATPAAAVQPVQAVQQSAASAPADERGRIKAILGCEEAKTRPALAQHLALETSMSAAEAVAMLKVAAPEAAAQAVQAAAVPASQFMAQMQRPGASAGVKPEAQAAASGGAAQKPSIADKTAARVARMAARTNA